MRKILDLTEMPPVYIPKRRSNLKYAFQEMTRTLRTMRSMSSKSFVSQRRLKLSDCRHEIRSRDEYLLPRFFDLFFGSPLYDF